MRNITLEELLEAGCHFGHQVNRRNPKADEYIFEARNGVNIINLENTRDGLVAAGEYVSKVASQGGSLLIVGTKRQCKSIIEEEVKRAKEAGAQNLYYITSRWIGGVLTNNQEVSKNFKRLKELETFLAGKDHGEYTKREVLLMEREKEKLNYFYGGVAEMKGNPNAVFIIDTHTEETAVGEAQKVHVPIVGIVDTNADPTVVDYPIPSNDDAVGAIKLITGYIVDAYIEGSDRFRKAEEGDLPAGKAGRLQGEAADKRGQKKAVAGTQPKEEGKPNGVKADVNARVAKGEQGSKESPVAGNTSRAQDQTEAVVESAAATGTQSKRMDTKPAVKHDNREVSDKRVKKGK